MATNINFYLNETKVNPPQNWRELGIELNFDKDRGSEVQQTTLTDFNFVNENASIINKWITDGIINGVGVFEGIPLRIELERDGLIENVFNGFLDLTQLSSLTTNRASAKATETESVDWLNDVADSFTFSYLYDVGKITDDNFVSVPYIINSVPNYVEAAVSVIGVYLMVKEIKDAIQRLKEVIAELPIYYVFSTYIKLILFIIYLILLIIALIKLVKQVILLLIQPVKYHKAMSFLYHCQVGAQALGLTFRSPILESGTYSDAYLLPRKYYNPINSKDSQLLGFTEPSIEQRGFYTGTYGEWLRQMIKMFNGKLLFKGTELWLVREDESNDNNQYQMPAISNNYDFRNAGLTFNTDEFNANTLISFVTDGIDKNTIQEYLGTSYQVILEPARVINQNMTLMKGLDEIRIPFALAKRKETFTDVEKIFNTFLKVFDVIVGALVKVINAVIFVLNLIITLVNNILKKLAQIGIKIKFQLPLIPKVKMPNFKQDIENRIGMLKIEKDIINVDKVCLLTLGNSAKYNKLHVDNWKLMTAKALYENFYYSRSFMPSQNKPNANQYFLYSYQNVPFSFNDYLKVKQNNCIFTQNGEKAIVNRLKWNIWNQKAEIKLRINKLYTNNFKATYLEPDGR